MDYDALIAELRKALEEFAKSTVDRFGQQDEFDEELQTEVGRAIGELSTRMSQQIAAALESVQAEKTALAAANDDARKQVDAAIAELRKTFADAAAERAERESAHAAELLTRDEKHAAELAAQAESHAKALADLQAAQQQMVENAVRAAVDGVNEKHTQQIALLEVAYTQKAAEHADTLAAANKAEREAMEKRYATLHGEVDALAKSMQEKSSAELQRMAEQHAENYAGLASQVSKMKEAVDADRAAYLEKVEQVKLAGESLPLMFAKAMEQVNSANAENLAAFGARADETFAKFAGDLTAARNGYTKETEVLLKRIAEVAEQAATKDAFQKLVDSTAEVLDKHAAEVAKQLAELPRYEPNQPLEVDPVAAAKTVVEEVITKAKEDWEKDWLSYVQTAQSVYKESENQLIEAAKEFAEKTSDMDALRNHVRSELSAAVERVLTDGKEQYAKAIETIRLVGDKAADAYNAACEDFAKWKADHPTPEPVDLGPVQKMIEDVKRASEEAVDGVQKKFEAYDESYIRFMDSVGKRIDDIKLPEVQPIDTEALRTDFEKGVMARMEQMMADIKKQCESFATSDQLDKELRQMATDFVDAIKRQERDAKKSGANIEEVRASLEKHMATLAKDMQSRMEEISKTFAKQIAELPEPPQPKEYDAAIEAIKRAVESLQRDMDKRLDGYLRAEDVAKAASELQPRIIEQASPFEGMQFAFDIDDDQIVWKLLGKDGAVKHQQAQPIRWPRYKGVYSVKGAFSSGDSVTHDGSLWMALKDNPGRPGESFDDWRLIVKKGRDGKDAKPGKDGREVKTYLEGEIDSKTEFFKGDFLHLHGRVWQCRMQTRTVPESAATGGNEFWAMLGYSM